MSKIFGMSFADAGCMVPCDLGDPSVQTVGVVVDLPEGTVDFHINEDRLGWVDPKKGQEAFDRAVEAAHLFVAAPDLLAAANRIIEGLADGGELEGLPSGTPVSVPIDDIVALCEAIAKAKGGAS
jgi:hypothetical protein